MQKGWIKSIKTLFKGKKEQFSSKQAEKQKPAVRTLVFPTKNQQTNNFPTENMQNQENEEEDVKEIQDIPDADSRYLNLQNIKCPDFEQILPGQVILINQKNSVQIKIDKDRYIPGQFILTNYQFIFFQGSIKQSKDNHLKIPLGLISNIQKRHEYNHSKEHFPKLFIELKDLRSIKFKIQTSQLLKRIYDFMVEFTFVKFRTLFFAFRYFQFNKKLQNQHHGWKIYNPIKQFTRMKLKISKSENPNEQQFQYKYLNNSDYKICSTYPSILVVPAKISHQDIIKCSKFRSRQRLPTLTFALEYSPNKFSTLFRCSQNKVGVGRNRCHQDQLMLRYIGDPNLQSINEGKLNCKIYDARGYYAAVGNMFGGKGYEYPEYYKNCQIQWLDIPNIHSVRQSYNKFKLGCFEQDSKYLEALKESRWYDYIFLILTGSRSVAYSLKSGKNCMVHCSDGWDRTTQLCVLAQIMLDPYYRTIQGFQVLIQKDWISFGHQFGKRLSQGKNKPNDQERSPIFLQFLDCVTQIMYQFPLSFQFNNRLITDISKHIYTHLFGNFLYNCEQNHSNSKSKQNTISLWSYINSNKQKYKNPYYQPKLAKFLDISPYQKHYRLWKQHFFEFQQNHKDVYGLYNCEWVEENILQKQKQLKQKNIELKKKQTENQNLIKLLSLQLERLKQIQKLQVN